MRPEPLQTQNMQGNHRDPTSRDIDTRDFDSGGIYIAGRGLACALGTTLADCTQHIQRARPTPQRIQVSATETVPYFSIPRAIPLTHEVWSARAKQLVQQVVAECLASLAQPLAPETPLFIATSSLDVGRLELGAVYPADPHTVIEEMADWIDWRGPVFWVSSACTSSVNALLSAQRWIQANQSEDTSGYALVLGIELQNKFSTVGFHGMQLLAASVPQPLDSQRDGLVLGEAVSAMLLSAKPARWRLQGGVNQINGTNPLGADAAVLTQTITQTLQACGLAAEQIDLIKLQAAGSVQNDAVELESLHQVFQALPSVTTLKSYLGHTLGASGVAELALLTACLDANICPDASTPAPDPALGARCCASWPTLRKNILFNTLGFGGGHCCLVLNDSEHDTPVERPS